MHGDVRIGDYWYKLAEGVDDSTLGVSFRRFPYTRQWSNLFASRTATSGGPGIQNLKAEDLRWVSTDFGGGEGQSTIDGTDPAAFNTFQESVGLDFSSPGQMQLARAMAPQGSTGASGTTIEGSAFTDSIGASTVVAATDRQLSVLGDRITTALGVMSATSRQISIFAYRGAVPTTLGKDLQVKTGNTQAVGNQMKLKTEGTIVQTPALTPTAGAKVTVTFDYSIDAKGSGKFTLDIWNATDGAVVSSTQDTLTSTGAVVTGTRSMTYSPATGKNYRYRITMTSLTGGLGAGIANDIAYVEGKNHSILWELLRGAAVVDSGTVDLTSVAASASVGGPTFTGDGSSYSLRVTWSAGADVKLVLDKISYGTSAMGSGRVTELGLNNRFWLADYSAGAPPNLLHWKEETGAWTSVGATTAPSGAKAIALAHSDNYEFVACDDKVVYRGKLPSTVEAYTAAATDPIVGITVGGKRLHILTESVAGGTRLYPIGTQATIPAALGTAIKVGNAGINPDTELTQRIASTVSGCTFFVNQGPDCFVYTYDGSILLPFVKLPEAFAGRAIIHGDGLTWVGGGFPAVDTSGVTQFRPAVFEIDASGNSAQIPVQLWRDGDAGPSKIISMQLYGTDLWVACERGNGIRLWRVSLDGASPSAYLHQEYTFTTSGTGRGFGVTWQNKYLLWSSGSPAQESTTQYTSGTARWTSSVYAFNLSEAKRLDAIAVVGTFPATSSVVVEYNADGAGWVIAGTLNGAGSLAVSNATATVLFHSLQLRLSLAATDAAVTPVVLSAEARAYVTVYEKLTDLILDTSTANSVRSVDGVPLEGYKGADYLYALADAGTLVEFEDRFFSTDDQNPKVSTVAIQNPTRIMFARGDGAIRVELLER